MKQLIQSYKTGNLDIFDVPSPLNGYAGILVQTNVSLVSAGTEKMLVDLAKKSLVGKAKARPDLVKQVVHKMLREGIRNTLEKVFTKLDTPIPLGYSCAGKVIEVGRNVPGVSIGDRVACGGAGYANHGEINFVPKNLFARIPDGVSDEDAAFVTVGSIALQGVRQAEPRLGENVVVIGLGLIGQLTVQLLKANGCRVLGSDIDPGKTVLAQKLGADSVCAAGDLISAAAEFTRGFGADAVIITASTDSSRPVADAGEVCRPKGKVVVVGMVGMDIPRNLYYKKELDIRLSMAYGPGRYDAQYEEKGIDYPYNHVRWTEQRNFEAFLNLVAEGKITPGALVTHRFEFEDALKAYDLLEGKTDEKYLGIILNYRQDQASFGDRTVLINQRPVAADKVAVGLIGAGNFTKSVILPALKKTHGIELVGLCTATGISAHSTGTRHGFQFITTDAAEMFKNPSINSVVVTTRHSTHADYVIDALESGKHVFVEKPLCLTRVELDEIEKRLSANSAIRDVKKAGPSILQVGYNRRFSSLIRRMKEVAGNRPMSILYRVNAGMIPKESWIQDTATGGGRIIGEVCHFVDTVSYLAGGDPVSVYAACVKKNDQFIPDEDNVNIVLNFANGSTATIGYFAYGNRQVARSHFKTFLAQA